MQLLELYYEKVNAGVFSEDGAQIMVVAQMQRIIDELHAKESAPQQQKQSLFKKFFTGNKKDNQNYIKGLYCYGGVGRGKTALMDLFIEGISNARKRRYHFHRFMLEVRNDLQETGRVANPIDIIIKSLSEEVDVLCIDEFFVSDITDAMLFDRMFAAFKKYNITLVTTSNIEPQQLYRGGLQRERFLPAIAWIEENTIVHQIDDGEDFRHRHFSYENVIRCPDSPEARFAIKQDLQKLTGETENDKSQRRYYCAGSREIAILFRLEHAVMFDFKTLCQGNYSQKDYIEIAKRFTYVALVGIPVLNADNDDAAKRFLLLIDEFYDSGVKLLLSTNTNFEDLYQGTRYLFEYRRILSRLFDMQSKEYWSRAHLRDPSLEGR